MAKKKIHIQYYALLREERGLSRETVTTDAKTVQGLYQQLQAKYHFRLSPDILRVAINDEFVNWRSPLQSNDTVVFIPPVAGG